MRLNQEKIERMFNARGSMAGGGGGGSESIAGLASQAWTEENYVSKAFFNELFIIHKKTTTTVYDGDVVVSTTVDTSGVFSPNEVPSQTESTDAQTGYRTVVETEVDNIEAKKGLWTDYFLSALGLNSSGGGGGSDTLAGLLDVELDNPTANQVLTYYNGKWRNMSAPGVDMNAVWQALGDTTTTQQIAHSHLTTALNGYATQLWVGQQGFLTSADLSGYATQLWVTNNFSTPSTVATQMQTYAKIQNGTITIGDASLTPITSVGGTFWGNSWTNGGTVTGSLTGVVQIDMTGHLVMHSGGTGIYLNSDGTGIDWHNAAGEYVSSLIAFTSAQVQINQDLYIPSPKIVRIGDAVLVWDGDNNALKLRHASGANASVNFYATGGVSALGYSDSGGGGGGGDVTWDLLASNTDTRPIALSHLTGALAGYATTSQLAGYLPLTGGTLTGSLQATNALRVWTEGTRISIGQWDGTNNRIETVGANLLVTIYGSYALNIGHDGYGNDFIIDAGGNVGIGTASPSYKLHVDGHIYASSAVSIGTSSSADLSFLREDSDNFINIASGGRLKFYTHGVGVTGTILANGDWGIGTSSPSYKLHVAGTMRASGNTSIGGTLDVTGNATASSFIKANGTSTQFLKADGSVDSSSYITSADLAGYATENWVTNQNYATSTQLGNYLPLTAGSTKPLIGDLFISKGNAILKVGNAVLSPAKAMAIGQWDGTNNRIETVGANLLVTIYGSYALNIGHDGYGNDFIIDAGGNVGIGTVSPSYKLHVDGAIYASSVNIGTSSSADLSFLREDSDNFINIASGGRLKFYTHGVGVTGIILANGDWGIGTSSPSYKLHVDGTMYASGNTSIGGTLDVTGNATASSFIKANGTSAQFLKADGSVDSTSYATASSVSTLEGYFTNGVANEAAKLSTVSKTAWGQTYWTSGGVPDTISGNIENAGNITPSTSGTYNIGTSSLLWNNIYAKYGYYSDNVKVAKLLSVNCDPFYSGTYKITVQGAVLIGDVGTATIGIGWWDGANNRFENGGRPLLITSYSQPIKIGLNGDGNTLVIDTSDNVGIGTTSPSYKLHVAGAIYASGAVNIGTSSSADLSFLREDSDNYINVARGGRLCFYTFGVGVTGAILANGDWGIGTSSPSYKLHVAGTMRASGNIYTSGHLFMNSDSTGIYLNNDGASIRWHDASNSYVSSLISFTSAQVQCDQDLYIPSTRILRIGDAVLLWDSGNNALKLQNANGVAANFYTTGGVSALGISGAVDGTVNASLIPSTTGTYTLGNTSYRWKELYLASTNGSYNGRIYVDYDGINLDSANGGWFGGSRYMIEGRLVIGTQTDDQPNYDLYVAGNTYVDGTNAYFYGNVSVQSLTQRSDMRIKDVISDMTLKTSTIAQAPLFKYKLKQGDGTVMVGSSAQYWDALLPEVIHRDAEGILGLDYGVTALASVISVAKEVTEHERRIARLEAENAILRAQIEDLKAA